MKLHDSKLIVEFWQIYVYHKKISRLKRCTFWESFLTIFWLDGPSEEAACMNLVQRKLTFTS